MNRKFRKRSRATSKASEEAGDESAESTSAGLPAARRSRRRIVRWAVLGLLVAGLGGIVVWGVSRHEGGSLTLSEPGTMVLREVDESKIPETCSHCHQLPTPDVLPRAAWKETVWRMFGESGQGTTVRWPFDPEALVAWFEERAPERLDFPDVRESSAPSSLPLVKRSIAIQGTASAPVVSNILVSDVVGDSRPELIVCDMLNGQILMARTGRPAWKLESIAQVTHPAQIEPVDLDANGRRDLVVANLGSFLAMDHNLGSVEWLRQKDDETFERITLADGRSRLSDVQPFDFDADGDLDLVVAEFGARSTGRVIWLENQSLRGSSIVYKARQLDGLQGASHVDVADLDGDGHKEIVVLYSQNREMVRCYLPQGGSAYTVHDLYRAPYPTWGFTGSQVLDLDQDGDLDILLTNGDTYDNNILKPYHGVQWLENTGAFPFEPHQLASVFGAYCAKAADMDGDGDVDVAACALISPEALAKNGPGGSIDSVVWFEQESSGQFVRHTLESDHCHHPTLTLGDYDLDGDVDLLVGNGQLQATADSVAHSGIDLWENQSVP